MEYFNKIVCVTVQELTSSENGEPVISLWTLYSLIRRGKAQRVNRGGGLDNYALIDYLSLPERYRIRFEQKYGDPVELIKEKCMKNRLKIDEAARIFFEDYRYDKAGELVSLTEPKKAEYTINASVLNELISIRMTGRAIARLWVEVQRKYGKRLSERQTASVTLMAIRYLKTPPG